MRTNKKVILRLARNILISLLSAGWIVPLIWTQLVFYTWIYEPTPPNYNPEIAEHVSDFGFRLNMMFFLLTAFWLAAVVVFWAFVAANKLWPTKLKLKPTDEQKQ